MKKCKAYGKMWLVSLLLMAVFMAGCGGSSDSGGGGYYNGGGGGGSTPDTTAPTVTLVSPADGSPAVAINRSISAAFSKVMDPLTINTTTYTLTGPGATPVSGTVACRWPGPGGTPPPPGTGVPGTDVPGTVDTAGVMVATFTPTSNLAVHTTYTATITTAARDLAGNALAANYVWSFTTGAGADITAPTVTLVSPANGSPAVAINRKISASFSKEMDPLSINTTTFKLTGPGITPVSGTAIYVGLVATFTPAVNLAANTTYTATITTGAKDLAGNPMAANYVWSFTTGAGADTTAPTVTLVSPADGSPAVAINRKIAATFSKEMDPLTITTTTCTVTGPGVTPVSGTVIYVGLVATFTPTSNLAVNTLYTATITTGVKDLAGNALAANYVWSFTTGAGADTTAPTVTLVSPADGSPAVAINRTVSATFSKEMDPVTITNLTCTVAGPGVTPVSGTVIYVGHVATFTPTANLAVNTLYTATITTGAKDLAGNAMAANYVWTFTTGAAVDNTLPTVTLVSPLDKATGVPINKKINATFNKDMLPATITNLNFTLKQGAAVVLGTVTYDAITKTATFKSTANLATDTLYTATITTGVKDLAGNAMAADYPWSFTTGKTIEPPPVVLGPAIKPFGCFGGGAGMTNQGLLTVINGDIGTTGAATVITGFHQVLPLPGIDFTVTPLNRGVVNGTIYASTVPGTPIPAGVALDARTAYTSLQPAALPGGIDLGSGQLGGRTLPPGIYQAAGGSYLISGSDLTLDGQGDQNAVWVFQMATSLTVGGPGAAFPQSVKLINGAKAKNIFWQVGSAATINAGGGGTMEGTIIAEAGCAFSTAGNVTLVTLNGRAIGLSASVTLVNTVINIPAP